MYTVLLQDGILCRCPSGPFDQCVIQFWSFFVGFFLVWTAYLLVIEYCKSPTITVLGSICVCNSSSPCLMKLGAPTLCTYRLSIFMSWGIAPFISMKLPSLSLLTNLDLKSTLSKYSYSCLFSRAIWLVNLFPPFHSKPMFVSVR
jgi:hypothetical protein